MENLWELIAEKRGLKIGEEFKYSGNYSYIVNRITEEGIEFKKDTASSSAWKIEDQNTLANFIIGVGTIKKLPPKFADPIKCKNGEHYNFIRADGSISESEFNEKFLFDLYNKKLGNMFAVGAIIPQEQIDKIVKEMKE